MKIDVLNTSHPHFVMISVHSRVCRRFGIILEDSRVAGNSTIIFEYLPIAYNTESRKALAKFPLGEKLSSSDVSSYVESSNGTWVCQYSLLDVYGKLGLDIFILQSARKIVVRLITGFETLACDYCM